MRSTMSEVDRELAEAKREMERELREADREVREAQQAQREAMREAREAQREALREAQQAQREAALEAREQSRTALLSSISYARSSAHAASSSGPDCKAMNKQIAMSGKNGLTSQAWAVVAGCGGFEVKVDRAARRCHPGRCYRRCQPESG